MENRPSNQWIKYSAFAIQMAVTLLIFVYIGRWADEQMKNSTPYATLTLILIGIIGMLYKLIREVQQ